MSERIEAFVRHSGSGHLRLPVLLCLSEVLRWRRKFEVASCRLPLNTLEHDRQITGEVVGVLKSGEVGEMETSDVVVGEVVWLLASAVCELPVDHQDIALVGEESRVSALLLVENSEVGESIVGCSVMTACTLVFGQCLTVYS